MTDPGRRRSAEWFDRQDMRGFIHRAFTKASGFTPEDMGRPLIGIAQTWSELNHCNSHLRGVAEAVKRGVWQAGGWPMEFPTFSGSAMAESSSTTSFWSSRGPLQKLDLKLQHLAAQGPG
jgi:dihydroxyacid dehydratase/phosphogluconate dehydratase